MNTSGALGIRAENVGSATVLSQIVQLVAQAQRSRAPMQRMADHVAGYFVMAVVGVAIITLVVWGLFGPQPSWVYGLINRSEENTSELQSIMRISYAVFCLKKDNTDIS